MIVLREKKILDKEIYIGGNGSEPDRKAVKNILEKEDMKKLSMGFAVDIGTTTVAMRGFLFKGQGEASFFLGKRSGRNSQTQLGKDVMMRIMHALSGKAALLQEMIVDQIERDAVSIIREYGIEETVLEKIQTEFVIVGNTAMCHLFLGESVEGLKGAPFQPAYIGNQRVSGDKVNMQIFRNADVFVLSGIAAHVGADALAVIGRTGLKDEEKISLAIDVGTNAEIVLNKKGKLFCCSAAAGPAFEGRGVSCGLVYGPGVITGVRMAIHTGNIILEFLPGDKVKGICGSGLLDTLAELRKTGLLTEDGYLLSEEDLKDKRTVFRKNIRETDKGRAFFLYGDQKASPVYLTQEDIRNLQLAKSAIAAAVSLLMKEADVANEQLTEVILTGVLGSSIRIESALRIGLLPQCRKEVFSLAGNAALDGAEMLLKKKELRAAWESLAVSVKHLELAEKADFQELLMRSMAL